MQLSDLVVVIEKEHRSDLCHRDQITGVTNLNDLEFLTCGQEQCLKVWDKSLQTCDYTIETHQPISSLAITGERGDILIAALGHGNLIVYGLTHKNQHDIVEEAHAERIVQIVSLTKLKNKYFASRCVLGSVNIWSSTAHPDRLFTIESIEKDESTMLGETLNQSKDKTGLSMTSTASDKDKMIELIFDLKNQPSSTVLCFSNYNDKSIIIAVVDLKTRRKHIMKSYRSENRPTFLYQINEYNLLVGTEGGKIEHWSI